jgi:hypothetical protein
MRGTQSRKVKLESVSQISNTLQKKPKKMFFVYRNCLKSSKSQNKKKTATHYQRVSERLKKPHTHTLLNLRLQYEEHDERLHGVSSDD